MPPRRSARLNSGIANHTQTNTDPTLIDSRMYLLAPTTMCNHVPNRYPPNIDFVPHRFSRRSSFENCCVCLYLVALPSVRRYAGEPLYFLRIQGGIPTHSPMSMDRILPVSICTYGVQEIRGIFHCRLKVHQAKHAKLLPWATR